MRPTMADVAEHAGVSTTTVSLVLNDKPGVSQQVRTVVLQAVDQLGYQLPRQRTTSTSLETKTITIIHFDPPGPANRFGVSGLSATYVQGVQDFCQSQNINWALIANYRDGDDDHVGFHLLQAEKLSFDGLIMMEMRSRDNPLLQQALQDNIPVVVTSRDWPDVPVNTVSQDHRQQANTALQHLIQLGHHKIAFLAREADQLYDWFKIRLDCYRKMMATLNNEIDQDLIAVGPDPVQVVKALLDRRPDVTAIFCINDGNAIGAMRGLREMDLAVPEHISVIGIDNSTKPPSDYPALTTVAFPHYRVGYLAAETLLRRIQDPELFYSRIFVRSYLVERASCAPPRAS
ncbi:MAG: LacI family DNA-binding transcriptional regulator [Anaerolineae bacterium]|nr:LacI family DNA-binding transcriptional regulator [Anaerolineae bacterium]